MDPLSVTTAVVTSLQVACSILSSCYSVRAGMRKIPWTLIQIIEEVRDLRNLIETVESVLEGHGHSCPGEAKHTQVETSQLLPNGIKAVIANCVAELRTLESRIGQEQVAELLDSRRKAALQSLKWRLRTDEAKESISSLQKCKAALSLAISSHNSLVIRNIERLSITMNHKMDQSTHQVDILARDFSTARFDEKQKAVVDWLSPVKPGRSHSLARAAHQSGTSEWFQRSKDFQEWLKERNAILWLSGPPGSGKTVMMSHAVESVARQLPEFEDEGAVYAFAYCDFRNPDTQNVNHILGTILSQLCIQLDCFPQETLAAYQSAAERGNSLTTEVILEAIEFLTRKRRAYLFIDGIDEVGDFRSLAEHLVSLTDSASCVNILATSRDDVVIQRVFKRARRVSLSQHVPEIDEDIEQYILERLSIDPDLAWLSPEIQNLVSTSLLSKSKGTFRWAACQLDSLSQCRTIRDIKKSLAKLPQGLHETYGRLLARSSPSDVPVVRKIMTWLSFSTISITLHQLWEALAIERGARCIDGESRLRSPQDIVLLCNSLVTVSSDGYVMLAHLSVRDYLLAPETKQNQEMAKFALDPKTGHMELALDCLTYLSLSDLSSGPSKTQMEYMSRLTRLPLLPYATKYWFYHTLNAQPNCELHSLTIEFFSPNNRGNFMSWVQAFNADFPFKWSIYPKHATSLYYAASVGLNQAVEWLLHSITHDEVNAPGSRFGGTAIHAATIRGHLEIVQRLIAAGADPGKPDFNRVTPLHSAASQGSMRTIKVLLDHGASRDSRDGMTGRTPAEWARLSGHVAAASMIEEHSASPDQQEGSHVSTLRGEGNCSPEEAESQKAVPWQPSVGYFPDFYERRSGLESSRIIGMTVGEEVSSFDGNFTLIEAQGKAKGTDRVW